MPFLLARNLSILAVTRELHAKGNARSRDGKELFLRLVRLRRSLARSCGACFLNLRACALTYFNYRDNQNNKWKK